MKWFKRVYLLYIFGFLINFRPVDPFLYEFFVTHKNISEREVRRDILPVLSYSSAIHALFAFLFLDLIGYKALIIISSLFALVSTSVKKWGTTKLAMEFSEVNNITFLKFNTMMFCRYFEEVQLQHKLLITFLFTVIMRVQPINELQHMLELRLY